MFLAALSIFTNTTPLSSAAWAFANPSISQNVVRCSDWLADSAIFQTRMTSPPTRSTYRRISCSWVSSENPSRSCSRELTRAKPMYFFLPGLGVGCRCSLTGGPVFGVHYTRDPPDHGHEVV